MWLLAGERSDLRWAYVAGDENTQLYVDVKSARFREGRWDFWIKSLNPAGHNRNRPTQVERTEKYVIVCGTGQLLVESYILKDGAGSILAGSSIANPETEAVAPDSVGEIIYEYACKDVQLKMKIG